MAVQPIPPGYHSITPYLIVRGAAAAIDFYKHAFGAAEMMRLPGPDGRIGHAELRIGDSVIMLADEHPEHNIHAPQKFGGAPSSLLLYVDDCDAVFHRASAAGAKESRPLRDQFYGDRSGAVVDPFGHTWFVATHKEDLTPEEIDRRMREQKA